MAALQVPVTEELPLTELVPLQELAALVHCWQLVPSQRPVAHSSLTLQVSRAHVPLETLAQLALLAQDPLVLLASQGTQFPAEEQA